MKIKNKSKPMTIAEIIKKNPEMGERLARQGFACAGCPLAQYETFDEGAMAHGISGSALRKAAGLKKKKAKKVVKKKIKRKTTTRKR